MTNTMNHHRFEKADRRVGRADHPLRIADAGARLMKQSLGANHRDAFEIRVPDRNLRRALELRYQVYCVECSFLSPEDYPDGVETDEHDDEAKHFYAFDAKGELVGYVRVVHPDVHQRFPFQRHCATSHEGVVQPVPGRTVEVSRLMLRCDYRRLPDQALARGATGHKHAGSSGDRRDEASQVLMSLYRQLYTYSRANDIDHWYAAMERPLARSLKRLNITFTAIGPEADYYGPVAPYLANLHEVEAQVGARNPTLLAWLQQPERDCDYTGIGQKVRLAPMRYAGETAF